MSSEHTVTLSVTQTAEFEVPLDAIADTSDPKTLATIDRDELKFRAEDFFWSHWSEFVAAEQPTKDDFDVVSAKIPLKLTTERRCTECGASVEDEPYEFWLFSTCRDCVEGER